jgi:hypothetical protein
MARKFRGKKIFLPTNLLAISQWNETEVIRVENRFGKHLCGYLMLG